jgi:hypothetical protein
VRVGKAGAVPSHPLGAPVAVLVVVPHAPSRRCTDAGFGLVHSGLSLISSFRVSLRINENDANIFFNVCLFLYFLRESAQNLCTVSHHGSANKIKTIKSSMFGNP